MASLEWHRVQTLLARLAHRVVGFAHTFPFVETCLQRQLIMLTYALQALARRVALFLPFSPLYLLNQVVLVPLHIYRSELELFVLLHRN